MPDFSWIRPERQKAQADYIVAFDQALGCNGSLVGMVLGSCDPGCRSWWSQRSVLIRGNIFKCDKTLDILWESVI